GTRRAAVWMFAALMALSVYDLWNQTRHLPWIAESLGSNVPRGERFIGYADKSAAMSDWRDVGRWVMSKTPHDAVFLTPLRFSTFKWYAGRGEVATWKDMPQDAASINQWMARLNEIYGTGFGDPDRRWHWSLAEVGDGRLRQLAAKYHAGYAIVELIEGVPPLV